MDIFALRPLNGGVQLQPANTVLEQQLSAGFARQRVAFVNAVHNVQITVSLHDRERHQYFWSFWRSHMITPRPFLYRLFLDSEDFKNYECQFVPGSLQPQVRNGEVYRVTFNIRCKPLNDDGMDDAIIALLSTGDDPVHIVNELERLTNQSLPDAMRKL